MILAIDVGNTTTVLGCMEEGVIVDTVRMRSESGITVAEAAIRIRSLLHYMSVREEELEGAVMASVVPQMTEPLAEAVRKLTGRECLIVGPGVRTGLNMKIDDPTTLGADLAVGAVAAISCYSVPAIIIDMGTATSITVVDGKNTFRGGAILPGVKLGFEALASGTSLLPEIDISRPDRCIGTNTADCMRSGAILGTASMIDGMIDRMEEELGEKCMLLATGSLAGAIIPCCRHEVLCDENLLLKGLWTIYRKNTKPKT